MNLQFFTFSPLLYKQCSRGFIPLLFLLIQLCNFTTQLYAGAISSNGFENHIYRESKKLDLWVLVCNAFLEGLHHIFCLPKNMTIQKCLLQGDHGTSILHRNAERPELQQCSSSFMKNWVNSFSSNNICSTALASL